MPQTAPTPTKAPPTPTKKPSPQPMTEPVRRLNPERICPDQIHRVTRRILPELPF